MGISMGLAMPVGSSQSKVLFPNFCSPQNLGFTSPPHFVKWRVFRAEHEQELQGGIVNPVRLKLSCLPFLFLLVYGCAAILVTGFSLLYLGFCLVYFHMNTTSPKM